MWNPDTASQPLGDVARYDYVVLYDGQASAVSELKAINPNLLVLNLSSAVEVAMEHALISAVPNQWFLTQVGSTTTGWVSAEATSIPVAKTSGLFTAGQVAVLEDELVRIVKVEPTRLIVERGVKPRVDDASAHDGFKRIAAIVTRRPDMFEMDISTNCLRVTVDPAIGPETWGEFAARLSAARCTTADWDGVAADRVENSESFLVRWGKVPSIDPLRTNREVSDGYVAFDKAWIAGVRHHLELLRQLLGPHKLILANNGAPHYDLINGSNIENFPRFDTTKDNLPAMPYKDSYVEWYSPRKLFYSDWASKGIQPNLSTIMTYDYEPEPVAGEVLHEISPVTVQGYQKMRFSLATTLMNDGFFTYQLRVWGSRIGTYWFDEYDNAGKQKGYLGLPISDSRLALPPLTTTDKLGGHGNFSTSTQARNWTLYSSSGYSASAYRSSGTAKIVISRSGASRNGVIYYHKNLSVRSGSEYTVRFRARADRPTTMNVRIATDHAPWRDWQIFYSVPLTTSWQWYEYSGYSRGSDSDARLVFDLAGSRKTVWLDSVKMQSGSRLNIYRRDFEGGTVLLNASAKAVRIPLGVSMRKIAGSQSPVNNGALDSSFILPSRDGLILLKASSAARVPTYVTATASPSTLATAGAQGVISGRLVGTTSTGSGVASRTVSVIASRNGVDGWTTVGTTHTTRAGYFKLSVSPVSKTYYKVRFAGETGNYSGCLSKAMTILPRAAVADPGPAQPWAGVASVVVTGTLAPRHTAGTRPVYVYAYRLESGVWRQRAVVSAAVTDSAEGSRYSTRITLPGTGSWRFRALHVADAAHATSWSSGYGYLDVH